MERHIGTWYKENEKDKIKIGELIIDNDHIEFYSRFHGIVFPTTFIGDDGKFSYKIFVDGQASIGNNRVISYTSSHKVLYVLMQNFTFSKGFDIPGITEFSFIIPELTNWLGMDTVYYSYTEDDTPAAGEYSMPNIIIKSDNPKIEIYFESSSLYNSFMNDDSTEIKISQKPRIRVSYEEPVDIQMISSEIECLMQFFGLLIGKVSFVKDIRLTIKDQDFKSWLFINHDYSYNLMTQDILDKPRTYFYIVEDKIQLYYSNWRNFFNNDDFSLLRRIYFSVNDKKEKFAEEVFVEYMRFLDGYHARISGDAETAVSLKEALKGAKKTIKNQIFIDDNRPIFEDAIHKVLPKWKYNANNVGDIAEWIASGFIAKTQLSHRLRELDEKHLKIISNNALNIEKLPLKDNDYNEKIKAHLKRKHGITSSEELEEKFNSITEEQKNNILIEIYYKELGDTRNYYSHYKNDKTGLLSFTQLNESINVLKATIISIFLDCIGLEDIGRKMIAFDSELHFQTKFLIKQNEHCFLTPKAYYKKTAAPEGTAVDTQI